MKYAFGLILLYPAYMLFIFAIDMRIEKLRPYLNKHAVEVGVEAAYDTWEAKYSERETLDEAKRKAKQQALAEYVKRLERMMSE